MQIIRSRLRTSRPYCFRHCNIKCRIYWGANRAARALQVSLSMLQSNMLQNDRTRALLDSVLPQSQSEEGGIGQIVDFALGFLRRQYLVIIFTTVLALAASVIYLKITPPTYTGQVKVLFGIPKPQFVQQQSMLADVSVDNAQLDTQIQVIKSKAIATAVINQLKLADDPDFKAPESKLHSVFQSIRRWFGLPLPPEGTVHQEALMDGHVAAFEGRLTAARLGYGAVIQIDYRASSAERAAEIANAIANAYITDQLNAKFDANRTATTWLQERLKELGQQALTAERAVNAFKSQNNIVAAGGRLMDEQQVTELNSRLVAARAQTSDALTRVNRFETILKTNAATPEAIGNLDASGTDALN